MFVSEETYGKVRMNSYVPTQKAQKYLSRFHTVGWHECNSLYHQKYTDGTDGSLIFFTLKGEGILKAKDKSYRLTAGTTAIVLPYTPMEYYTCKDSIWEFYWINICGAGTDSIAQMLTGESASAVYDGHVSEAGKIIKELIDMDSRSRFSFEIEVSAKLQKLLHLIAQKTLYSDDIAKKNNNALFDIIAYIEENYSKEITLDELSSRFFISKNHLIRIFHNETGFTPYKYLKKYRLAKSCELLYLTDKSVEEICRCTGFSNVSNYIYQFRKLYGITPLKFRKENHVRN